MPKTPIKKCCVCGKPTRSARAKYCQVCADLNFRMLGKHYPHKTIEGVWKYIRKHGYVCYYTQMPLNTADRKSPWYVTLDHWIPGDDRKLVPTSALINEMKSDLSEDEFWYYIEQLANFKKKHSKIIIKKPTYWYRLCPKY